MLNSTKNQSLKLMLPTVWLLASSISMQSAFANEPSVTEGNVRSQTQNVLIDWNHKVRTTITSRLEKKLLNQLTAKKYGIELTQVVVLEDPVFVNANIVLAEFNMEK